MSIEVSAREQRAALHRALGDPVRLAIVDALAVSDRTPGELRDVAGVDWNLLAHHLGLLERLGIVVRQRSEGDHRHRYVRLRAGALEGLGAAPLPPVVQPLFICTHNSARSQFAAALWRRRTGGAAESAGRQPAPQVHPTAVKEARAFGVDLSRARPRGYDEVTVVPGAVVSVCDRAREAGPPFDVPTLHWSVPDPADRPAAAFRAAFADIAERVDRLTGAAA